MPSLVACPFCRVPSEASAADACPDCGLPLAPISGLAPGTAHDDDDEALPLDELPLPWTYLGRGRGALLGLSLAGLALFFAPWVRESAPELRVLTGLGFAQVLGWMWAPAVAWFVLLPLVVSRRSVRQMRGARVAAGFLAAIVLTTVAVRLLFTPASSPLRPARFEWAWGLHATFAVAALALLAAARFGGKLREPPVK